MSDMLQPTVTVASVTAPRQKASALNMGAVFQNVCHNAGITVFKKNPN